MSDERPVWMCPDHGADVDHLMLEAGRACAHIMPDGRYCWLALVPVSSVIPIARLREWVATARLERLLDDVECASNPNNEGANDAS